MARGISDTLVYKFSLDAQFRQLREKLMLVASTAAVVVDAEDLKSVPLNRQGVDSPAYRTISGQLEKIRKANPLIKYIYIMTRTDKEGVWQFMVDPDPLQQGANMRELTAYPGDKYDASRFPEMLDGFFAPSADKKISLDEWGASLSGYAPIRDNTGRAVAVLGVDLMAEDIRQLRHEVYRRLIFATIMGILTTLLLGLTVSRRVTKPINHLVEGTRRIANGELQFKVRVESDDEIGELAGAFNHMGESLLEARNKLQDYFYRMVEAFVRSIEAKDHYTRGHSDRVGELSERIALGMGFSAEKAGLLRRAAQLHDIGKLGIHEDILNKKSGLTSDEWQSMHQHPQVGKEILEPVFQDKEMLDAIKHHHEQYDGKGYPDGLKGEAISIPAQIVAVADAYDAMTTTRSYHRADSSEAAVEELKKASGIKFNPRVVEAFLRVVTRG